MYLLCKLIFAKIYLKLPKTISFSYKFSLAKFKSKGSFYMNDNCKVIKSSKYYEINSTLRLLGLRTNMNGTKLIRKCIYYIISSDNEFYILEDIFQKIILNYPELNSKQIRSEIGYALSSRNERLSKKNFEKVFGYEYDSFIFTPKNFIDEIVNIIF